MLFGEGYILDNNGLQCEENKLRELLFMYAVEFLSKITDGKIDVPEEYLQKLSSDVKIIILCDNAAPMPKKNTPHKHKSIKGIINRYANPELIAIEKEAWGEAVKDKHAVN